ncbi:siderophore-interacting protein [Actinocrispum wychmicini]|uniref:NADPH-dependent ferric siderophore reductase n=1 Tax=Actinocrispum wychmicini TaxID=1213861 RepID=A0A4R2K7F5_9PSEU|nr:siderophore-interacting protein [Actinocrispum wychmicini]TCO62285.1 NADPH-dependent ferric siderophore reductase [Actinocrispum wychmicini]
MPQTNMSATRIKPATSELLTLTVLRQQRISRNFVRITLGRGDVERFTPMGFDQWFRLFIPVSSPDTLSRLPNKLTMMAYLKYLTVAKTQRPLLRSYSARAYRPDGVDGPELDIDFVLHGSAEDGTAGPATLWAQNCIEGDPVALLDEGIAFTPPPSVRRVFLVADETGLPATAGILASLPPDTEGEALVEVPSAGDRQDLDKPDGVKLTWIDRDPTGVPGRAALAAAEASPLPTEPFYGWTVGESTLPVTLRRHWVKSGVPKENVMFCGYWKAGRGH